ncbi:MAG: hypothetical protein IKM86_01710, partial [Acidaminococcaceae bacterium]|nr:hypothetical protein [Acidaminococcaceae bacterium]
SKEVLIVQHFLYFLITNEAANEKAQAKHRRRVCVVFPLQPFLFICKIITHGTFLFAMNMVK